MECRSPKSPAAPYAVAVALLALAPSLGVAQQQRPQQSQQPQQQRGLMQSDDRIFVEPHPHGLSTEGILQTAAAAGDFILMWAVWPNLYPEAAEAKAARENALLKNDLPVTEGQRQENVRAIEADATSYETTSKGRQLTNLAKRRIDNLRNTRLYTQAEKDAKLLEAADEVQQARYAAYVAGRKRGLIKRTAITWAKVAGSTFFFADGAGRLYLWYWADVSPTLSPAATYLIENELGFWRNK